jgi:hypothetical protein
MSKSLLSNRFTKSNFIEMINTMCDKSSMDFFHTNRIKNNLYGYTNFLEDLANHTISTDSNLYRHQTFIDKMLTKIDTYAINGVTNTTEEVDIILNKLYDLMKSVYDTDETALNIMERERTIKLAFGKNKNDGEVFQPKSHLQQLKDNMMQNLNKDYTDLG